MFDLELQLKKILIKMPLLRSYIERLEFVCTTSVNTASTDGKHVFYNADNLSKRDETGQQFTLIHEIMHVALEHMNRLKNRDFNGFNYACDAVINQMIERAGIPIPKGSINCPDAIDYSVEEYYDLIRSRDDYDDLMASIESSISEGMITSHSQWESAGKDENVAKSSDSYDSDVPTNEKDFIKKNGELLDEEANKYFDSFGEGVALDNNTNSYVLKSVGSSTSFITWQELINYEVKKNKTGYDFFSGEFDENGIWQYPYQPYNDDWSEVEILIDTSFSVSDELVKSFLREVKSIIGNASIKVGCFNDKFDYFVEIKEDEDIDNFQITSRGGTDFEVAVQSFQNPNSTKIIFTDGCASEPKSYCEAIWIVYSDVNLKPLGGRVFNIDINELINSKKRI